VILRKDDDYNSKKKKKKKEQCKCPTKENGDHDKSIENFTSSLKMAIGGWRCGI
jgi:hypothetical protein